MKTETVHELLFPASDICNQSKMYFISTIIDGTERVPPVTYRLLDHMFLLNLLSPP